jgi:hypothetical protein
MRTLPQGEDDKSLRHWRYRHFRYRRWRWRRWQWRQWRMKPPPQLEEFGSIVDHGTGAGPRSKRARVVGGRPRRARGCSTRDRPRPWSSQRHRGCGGVQPQQLELARIGHVSTDTPKSEPARLPRGPVVACGPDDRVVDHLRSDPVDDVVGVELPSSSTEPDVVTLAFIVEFRPAWPDHPAPDQYPCRCAQAAFNKSTGSGMSSWKTVQGRL